MDNVTDILRRLGARCEHISFLAVPRSTLLYARSVLNLLIGLVPPASQPFEVRQGCYRVIMTICRSACYPASPFDNLPPRLHVLHLHSPTNLDPVFLNSCAALMPRPHVIERTEEHKKPQNCTAAQPQPIHFPLPPFQRFTRPTYRSTRNYASVAGSPSCIP